MKTSWIKLLLVFLTCFSFLAAIIIFSKGFLILGGEGNYITNFRLAKEVGSYAWVSINAGTGYPNPTLNGLTVIFDFFSFLQQIGIPFKTINLFAVFLVYMLPFLFMLWLLNRVLKVTFFTA